MTIFGFLATLIDSLFRAAFVAYFTYIAKEWVLVLLLSYFVFMLISVLITKREGCQINSGVYD